MSGPIEPKTEGKRVSFSTKELRPWRKRLRLTQRKMGERFGLTEGSYRQWEAGRMSASKRLLLLVDALRRIEKLERELVSQRRNRS